MAAVMLAGAACGSSGSTVGSSATSTSRTAAPTTTAAVTSATVDLARSPQYGVILADASGRTLYMLTADTPTSSACATACIAHWPPVTATGGPTAGTGVTAALLGTITRSDGAHQVTYAGHQLYTFARDTAAGQVNGQRITAFGGTWYVLGATGQPVTTAPPAGTTTTTVALGY